MEGKILIELVQDFERAGDPSNNKDFNFCRGIKVYEKLYIHMVNHDIHFSIQEYETGANGIATLGDAPYIGVGSHYDVVPGSPGANDNGSAMAVGIDMIRKYKKDPTKNIGIRCFFFDEEEVMLRGSRSYVKEKGFDDLIGLYNMELVGSGNNLAFWAESSIYDGKLLKAIDLTAKEKEIQTFRFPNISKFLMNSGDHESFIERGMKEAFCITTISDKDVEMAKKYRLIEGENKTQLDNYQLMIAGSAFLNSDLFRNYHKPTDTSDHLSGKTLEMVSDILWNSIKKIDEDYGK